MVTTAREMLDQIDEFLAHADFEQAQRLWYVLTALRGPDSGSDKLKAVTTAIVRAGAFPKLLAESDNHHDAFWSRQGAHMAIDNSESQKARGELLDKPNISSHFQAHAQLAFGALGIKPFYPDTK